MAVRKRTGAAVLAAVLVLLLALPGVAGALAGDNPESPGGDGALLNSLLDQTQPTVTNEAAGTTGTPAAESAPTGSGTSGTSGTSGATGTSAPAAVVVPPATPLIVESYETDPGQLQSGTRFHLTLKITNPGADGADDVVVKIGPSSESGWGSSDELAVLGTGNAKYVGAIAAGKSDNSADFLLLANPTSSGGLRAVPVTITWKTKGFEHATAQRVGLLVNSYVNLAATFRTSESPTPKTPFMVTLKVSNPTARPVKGLAVVFSGKGARPSRQETLTIGDVGPRTTGSITATYTAPVVGRAKLLATVSYVDDFGDSRSLQVEGWAHVVRADENSSNGKDQLVERVIAAVAAVMGLNG